MTRPASLRAGSKRSLALCIRKTPFWTPTITACWLSVALCTVCIYANVIRSLLTEWCVATGQIPDTQYGFYPGPDTQYGFYPGRNTFLPMFILRHLQHAAQTIKPNGSPRCTLLLLILNKPMTPFQGMHYGNTLGVLACLRLCCL